MPRLDSKKDFAEQRAEINLENVTGGCMMMCLEE
jgi:hypothetical protein